MEQGVALTRCRMGVNHGNPEKKAACCGTTRQAGVWYTPSVAEGVVPDYGRVSGVGTAAGVPLTVQPKTVAGLI